MTGRLGRLTSGAGAPVLLYGLLALLVVPVFPHFTSPNELSRWVVAVAVVEHGTVEVTRVIENARLQNVEDLSLREGRLYSNKAPGALLLAIPGYLAARPFTGPGSPASMRPTLNAMRLAAATIPTILLALAFAAAARRLGCEVSRVRTAVAILLFATPLFAYGLLLFGHALSALTLFGAWALLFLTGERRGPQIAAGALIGLAVLTEYQNAIPATVLILCALSRLRGRGLLSLLAGGAPFAVLLALYNRLAFGGYLTLSSGWERDESFRQMAGSGLFGVGLPSAAGLWGLLLDLSKGVLILSPVLALSMMALRAARERMSGVAFAALLATPAALFLTISGYPNWHGGWTVGARYLAAILPFLVLLIACDRRRGAESFLAGASVAAIAVVSLVFPFVPPEYPAPWISFAWPLLQDGLVAPNLFHLVARPLAVVVPFAIVLFMLVRMLRSGPQLALAAAGIVTWIALGMIIDRATSQPRVARAIIRDVYFGQPGTIRAELPPAPGIARLETMAAQLRTQPPTSWPF